MTKDTEHEGHPTEGVFMKCPHCRYRHGHEQSKLLVRGGNGALHCPDCREELIPLPV